MEGSIEIGDWLMMDGNPIKVHDIYFSSYAYRVNDDYTEIDDIQPLQLTASILKKNGGHPEYMSGYDGDMVEEWAFDGYGIREISCEPDGDVYCFCMESAKGENIYKKCRYVHEWQHALRIMGYDKFAEGIEV